MEEMTVGEAAWELGVSRQRILQYVRRGVLSCRRGQNVLHIPSREVLQLKAALLSEEHARRSAPEIHGR